MFFYKITNVHKYFYMYLLFIFYKYLKDYKEIVT